ncbi:hypothetical protein DPMN_187574 [Dreissena polymorpha]|uniref:Uncharacterized protein n=1 Tax=Dreissena polymorpha TaxID=45954 RepID=A0A9D4IAH5_DREPO|nr:hypothetical protein DPMN_187574 [Dreissena polymorpha]
MGESTMNKWVDLLATVFSVTTMPSEFLNDNSTENNNNRLSSIIFSSRLIIIITVMIYPETLSHPAARQVMLRSNQAEICC